MVLILYMSLLSPACRCLYIFARLNRISFDMMPVDLLKAEHLSEEFVQVNPLMKVPVMKDEDFILRESVAILLYLCHRFRTPDHWYPAEFQKCARVDEFLAWQELNMKKHCSNVLWMKLLIPHFFHHTVPTEKLEEAMAQLSQTLDLFEQKFLQSKPFIVGDQISLADLMALELVVQVVSAGCEVFEERPWLGVWRKRVESIVGQELCHEAREPILTIKNNPPLAPDMVRKFDLVKESMLSH